jgi:hypothetical protein
VALSQGYLLTSIILSSTMVHIVDRRFEKAAIWMLIAAAFSYIGMIHGYELSHGYGSTVAAEIGPPSSCPQRYGGDFTVVYFGVAVIMMLFHVRDGGDTGLLEQIRRLSRATESACGACVNACCRASTGGASGEESGVVIVDNRHRTLAVGLDGTHTPTRLERLEKSANATLAVSTAAMQAGATSPRGISAMSKIPDSPLQESELQFLQPNTTEAQRGPYHDTIRMVPGSKSPSREIELRYRCATSENAATLKVPSKNSVLAPQPPTQPQMNERTPLVPKEAL